MSQLPWFALSDFEHYSVISVLFFSCDLKNNITIPCNYSDSANKGDALSFHIKMSKEYQRSKK